ncbi:J domain-containing protein [Maritalea porphyrae]|uniref:J domain-containing protein n=1 Tax=Maritalea porphyrae TaxID=880732 RepID=UPI0022AFE085|nr:J domain-containing protein [Maritalea porphyrae]MCZ4270779.1 J domain-containing protein [Maritalea porphyrae]
MTVPYPLAWPENLPRHRSPTTSKFRTSLAGALGNVKKSLKDFSNDSGKSVSSIVISSNSSLGEQRPKDAGVAVWFEWDNLRLCIAVDRYQKVEDNLQAIHHVLEARRTELRHGTLALLRASLSGLQALPSPTTKRSWRQVFGFSDVATISEKRLSEEYRELARESGGNEDKLRELNVARDEARKEIQNV